MRAVFGNDGAGVARKERRGAVRLNRFTLGIASFVLAAVFLAFDIFNINFMFGRTSVSIYPVIVFAGLGVVLFASRREPKRPQRG